MINGFKKKTKNTNVAQLLQNDLNLPSVFVVTRDAQYLAVQSKRSVV